MTKELKIEYASPTSLIPYINNAKQHSSEQVLLIASSIKEFGFNAPVLTDGDNGIVAGHGRVLAAIKVGLELVPTVSLSHLSDHQKKAYILADNRLGEVGAEWEFDQVSDELAELREEDFNICLTGFDISYLLDGVEEIDYPDLADGDREPYQKKTFTLHDEQVVLVDAAVKKAIKSASYDTLLNDNKNGNALALIAGHYIKNG